MRTRVVVAILLVVSVCTLARAQSSGPARQASALAVLTQAIGAAGGVAAVGSIRDFTASGTITYFWAGQQVQAPATVRGRGFDQFRLDAAMPEGTRSWAVSHGQGVLREPGGRITQIPYHNAINLGSLTFPYIKVSTILGDSMVALSDLGVVAADDGGQLRQVRMQRVFGSQADPDGTLSKLTITDYCLDATTKLLMRVVDSTHPVETFSRSFKHELDFENYSNQNGLAIPMLIREKIEGQATWELQLNSVAFNTGLTDSDFVIQ